jgi:hypothetical protein
MRATLVVIALAAAFALPSPAAAKGLPLDRVCGASDCVTFEQNDLMVKLYVGAVRPPPTPLPHYLLYRRHVAGALHFVPAKDLAGPMPAESGDWFRLNPTERGVAAIRSAIRRLVPFPAPKSWAARDDGRTVMTLPVALLLVALAAGVVLARRFGPIIPRKT